MAKCATRANSIVCALALLVTRASFAETATEVFRRASPSVVVVQAFDHVGHDVVQGSGVVIGQGVVLTNCHVARAGVSRIVVHRGERFSAEVDAGDDTVDLCRLSAPELQAPAASVAPLSSVKVGARLYAIGAPKGLDLTISDGLASGIRTHEGVSLIQTTAPISPGSSGGGLFTEDGRLAGITTYYLAGGQNLNFAVPAEYAFAKWMTRADTPKSFEQRRQNSLRKILAIHFMLEEKQYPEASRASQQWTESEPSNPFAWYFLGQAYEKQQIYGRAISAYAKALSLERSYSAAWHGLGNSYLLTDKLDLAREAFEEALVVDPEDSHAIAGLARLKIMRNDRMGALFDFERAVQVSLKGIPNSDALTSFCLVASLLELPEKVKDCRRYSDAAEARVRELYSK